MTNFSQEQLICFSFNLNLSHKYLISYGCFFSFPPIFPLPSSNRMAALSRFPAMLLSTFRQGSKNTFAAKFWHHWFVRNSVASKCIECLFCNALYYISIKIISSQLPSESRWVFKYLAFVSKMVGGHVVLYFDL